MLNRTDGLPSEIGYTNRIMPSFTLSAVIAPDHVPQSEWAARIAAAKRCGINTIETDTTNAGFIAECERQGVAVVAMGLPVDVPNDIESDALRAFAGGTTAYRFGDAPFTGARFAARRVALWAATWAHILLTGERKTGLKASRGLNVSETVTAQNGGIVFVENPSPDETIDGYVPPFLPEITLAPGAVWAYVHDAPVGEPVAGGKFLASYVGLVKSDARVLAAQIRPMPYEGARIYVYGSPGDSSEVVLFHGSERGTAVTLTFADTPQVYDAAPPSQIVALSTELAGRTFFPDDDNAPVIIGADDVTEHGDEYATVQVVPGRTHTLFALAAGGALTEINVVAPEVSNVPPQANPQFSDESWQEVEVPVGKAGWYRAVVELPDAGSAIVSVEGASGDVTVYANGVLAEAGHGGAFEAELSEGANVLALHTTRGFGAVSIHLSGACYFVEVTRWRFGGANAYVPQSANVATLRIAL
ncbi:MAG: hypothetical protein H7Y38_02020 [Armatimonadetes bacterium]|nr:hypothetical protein [Armatimonadota bacterium]